MKNERGYINDLYLFLSPAVQVDRLDARYVYA